MRTVGIIAEFNPFHNGHYHIINQLKQQGDRVVCVIGDDFTQRGDVALVSKYARAKMALAHGADLCVLMPVLWSMSCANNFAIGGVSLLKELSVDAIAFGSECADIKTLLRVSKTAHSEELTPLLTEQLKSGITFAKARQNALEAILGNDASILSSPNDTLATEYIHAAECLDFKPEFIAIKREGCAHDSALPCGSFASASAIRELVLNTNTNAIKAFMPNDAFNILMAELEDGNIADIKNIETAMLSTLRRLTADDFKKVPEVSEGLENKIVAAISESTSLLEALEKIKSKRYTLARIRRILLAAYLGINNDFFLESVPYIKVLGFNKCGEEIIKSAKTTVPLINRSRDYLQLENEAKKCFQIQNTAADLYALALKNPRGCGRELSEKLIKL